MRRKLNNRLQWKFDPPLFLAAAKTAFVTSGAELRRDSESHMKLLIFMMTLLLSGCVVYPINKTLQPEAEILVTDVEGKPIHDAWLYLISSSYPYGFEQMRRGIKPVIEVRRAFQK